MNRKKLTGWGLIGAGIVLALGGLYRSIDSYCQSRKIELENPAVKRVSELDNLFDSVKADNLMEAINIPSVAEHYKSLWTERNKLRESSEYIFARHLMDKKSEDYVLYLFSGFLLGASSTMAGAYFLEKRGIIKEDKNE